MQLNLNPLMAAFMDDPQVDDYVRWGNIEGWVYFKDSNHYITIEIGVRPKPNCEYTREEKHKYIHTLVCCGSRVLGLE